MNPVSRSDGARYDVKADSRFFERLITQYLGPTPILAHIFFPAAADGIFDRRKGSVDPPTFYIFGGLAIVAVHTGSNNESNFRIQVCGVDPCFSLALRYKARLWLKLRTFKGMSQH